MSLFTFVPLLNAGAVRVPKPELVRRFVAAVVDAFAYTAEHVDEATGIMASRLGGQPPEAVRQQVEATIQLAHTKRTESRPIGWSDPQDWKASLDLIVLGKYLKSSEVKPVSYYFTNEFVPHP